MKTLLLTLVSVGFLACSSTQNRQIASLGGEKPFVVNQKICMPHKGEQGWPSYYAKQGIKHTPKNFELNFNKKVKIPANSAKSDKIYFSNNFYCYFENKNKYYFSNNSINVSKPKHLSFDGVEHSSQVDISGKNETQNYKVSFSSRLKEENTINDKAWSFVCNIQDKKMLSVTDLFNRLQLVGDLCVKLPKEAMLRNDDAESSVVQ